MNNTITKVDTQTSDIIFNYVLAPVYSKCIREDLNDYETTLELSNAAYKYLNLIHDERYVHEDLVNDFKSRL